MRISDWSSDVCSSDLLVEGIGSRDEVAALELNVSCPNVHSGLVVGESPDEARSLLEALRPLTPKPLLVKLTPNVHPAQVGTEGRSVGKECVSKGRPGGSP